MKIELDRVAPESGTHVKITSLSPEIDGAIVKVGRVVPDWAIHKSAIADIFFRRLISAPGITQIKVSDPVYQVQIAYPSLVGSRGDSPFRNYQTIWVFQDELGPVDNKFSKIEDLPEKQLYRNIGNPNTCLYECGTARVPEINGIGFTETGHKVKKTCPDCHGMWQMLYVPTGVIK